jgi:hypothetical protein
MGNVEHVEEETTDDHFTGLGVAEGLFFDECAAGEAGHPVHLGVPENFLPWLAGIDVIVLSTRVFGGGMRIVADRNSLAVEMRGYEDFEGCAALVPAVKEFVRRGSA